MNNFESGIKVFDDDYVDIRLKAYVNEVNNKLKSGRKPHDKRYNQGFYVPTRPGKCINVMETEFPQPIIFRSGWEKQYCDFLNNTDQVLRWGSEVVNILYKDPLKNKMSYYVPDFYAEVLSNDFSIKKFLVEIKPLKEAVLENSSNGYDKLMVLKNQMKWQAAVDFCKKRNMEFKVLTDKNFNF